MDIKFTQTNQKYMNQDCLKYYLSSFIYCTQLQITNSFQIIKKKIIIILPPMNPPKQNRPCAPKSITTIQLLSTYSKNQQQRSRLLKQLEQLGLDLTQYHHLPLKDLIAKSQYIMNNTYSIKYLGLNKNQMGIISRRVNPLTDQDLKIHDNVNQNFSVHSYFYPKPLRVGRKVHNEQNINVDNLEMEIKREFEEKRVEETKKAKEYRDEKMKTKMAGSWMSSTSNDFKKKNVNCSSGVGFPQITQNIKQKMNQTQSFSRFLSKGILVIRD